MFTDCKFNAEKISILPKLIYRFKAISIKLWQVILLLLFVLSVELDKLISKFTWECENLQ